MRIAITADLHLTTRAMAPQQYLALEDILSQMIEMHVDTICTFALFRSVSGRKEWTPIPRLNPDRS